MYGPTCGAPSGSSASGPRSMKARLVGGCATQFRPRKRSLSSRAVGGSPVQALLMAGYLTPQEANAVVPDLRLDSLDDVVLLDELKRRAILRIQ